MGPQAQAMIDRESAMTAAPLHDSDAAEHAAPLDAMADMSIAEPAGFESPEAARTPPPADALNAFVQAIERARYPSPRSPGWWLATAIKTFDGLCAYCGRNAGSALDVDVLIPAVAGGPQRPDAAVLTCKACKRQRKQRDLLLWKPDASTRLHDMRAALALNSWNHLSRDPAAMQTPQRAAEVIAARWAHPRFHCHGALTGMGGFIGWRDLTQVPTSIPLRLMFDHSGWRLRQSAKRTNRRNNTAAIFWIPTPDGALRALWDVIEHNGLVRHVALDGSPVSSANLELSPVADWSAVFPTVADLVRRRWHQ